MNRLCSTLTAFVAIGAAALAHADELRNVKPGQPVPGYDLQTLSGETITNPSARNQPLLLVYLSARQAGSEKAAAEAHEIGQQFRSAGLQLHFVTADVLETQYFRDLRDRANFHEPLGLDIDRKLYGKLGLIVLPTTILVDREGRLAHVVSGYKSDYPHVIRAYTRHVLGLTDESQLQRELSTDSYQRDTPQARSARHTAAARLLCEKGLLDEAEQELRVAIDLVPSDAGPKLELAWLMIRRNRIDEASDLTNLALAVDPQSRDARLVRGVLLYHRGAYDEAETVLNEVLLLNPDPARTHYYLGLVCEKRGDKDRALMHYREALQRLMRER